MRKCFDCGVADIVVGYMDDFAAMDSVQKTEMFAGRDIPWLCYACFERALAKSKRQPAKKKNVRVNKGAPLDFFDFYEDEKLEILEEAMEMMVQFYEECHQRDEKYTSLLNFDKAKEVLDELRDACDARRNLQ